MAPKAKQTTRRVRAKTRAEQPPPTPPLQTPAGQEGAAAARRHLEQPPQPQPEEEYEPTFNARAAFESFPEEIRRAVSTAANANLRGGMGMQQALERAGIKSNLGWSYGLEALEMGSLMKALP